MRCLQSFNLRLCSVTQGVVNETGVMIPGSFENKNEMEDRVHVICPVDHGGRKYHKI